MRILIFVILMIMLFVLSCYKYENPLDPVYLDENSIVHQPTFSPVSGTYTTVQTVSISCSTSGASIRYTTNGTEPTESSSLYSSPISVSGTTTLKAKAFKTNYNPSSTATAAYTINIPTVATPSFSPASGTYTTVQSVSISCSTSGASIRYTTNGTEPTESSSLYSSPISVSGTTTLKAKAFKTNYNPSSTATATYSILVWSDNFNNLSAWTNNGWEISNGNMYVHTINGSFAYSESGGNGYGDTMSKSFTFSGNVILKLWLSSYQGFVTTYVLVDGVVMIQYQNLSGVYPPQWVQRQCNITSGTHTVTIQTNYAGDAGIDDLEIWSAP